MITAQMIAKAAQEGESRSQLQSYDNNTADRYVVFLDIWDLRTALHGLVMMNYCLS